MLTTCSAACDRASARAAAHSAEASGSVATRLDWYLFAAGLDYKAALSDLAALSGPQPIPPRYALGIWFSRWWPWSDWEADALLREFDERGVPCDVLITDMDWHHTCYRRTYGAESEKSMDASQNWPCWSGFSFDRKYFPEPEAFLDGCKARGVHNGFNLHFQSGLVKAEEDAETWSSFATALALPEKAEFRAFDPLNKTYAAAFHEHVLGPLERQGVDFWWLDWQQGEGLFAGSDVPEANPTWWLNYVYATQPDGREEPATHGALATGGTSAAGGAPADAAGRAVAGRPQRRRLIMHRWGGLGNQRYPIGFSGDVTSSWESLRFQPHFTATAANVNFGYWSHDIGGFYNPVEGELYVRWVQAGALSPIFRAHGFRDANIEKRFWLFADRYFLPMRAALRLRLELLPHLYTAARRAAEGGPSLVRPLYHEWPDADAAYEHPGQYALAEGLLVAPVTKPSDPSAPLARGVRVWIPPGSWLLTHAGLGVEGPATLVAAYALDEIPILARVGSVIFGQPAADAEWDHCASATRGWLGRAQRVPTCAQAAIWLPPPPEQPSGWSSMSKTGGVSPSAGRGELYEDDGWSTAYAHEAVGGEHTSRTTVVWRYAANGRELRVTIEPPRGCLLRFGPSTEPRLPSGRSYDPTGSRGWRRSWRVLLHGLAPPRDAEIIVGGAAGGAKRVSVRFADPPTAERLRRSGARDEPLWWFDPERLCVVLWLFDLAADAAAELVLSIDPAATQLATSVLTPRMALTGQLLVPHSVRSGALLAMRRAQAAKALLDATYPDTQPQDYDRVTWLAGLGRRLASHPHNFTREMTELAGTLEAARVQLRGEVTRRAKSSDLIRERARNATALVAELDEIEVGQ